MVINIYYMYCEDSVLCYQLHLNCSGADPGLLDRGFKFTKGGSIC